MQTADKIQAALLVVQICVGVVQVITTEEIRGHDAHPPRKCCNRYAVPLSPAVSSYFPIIVAVAFVGTSTFDPSTTNGIWFVFKVLFVQEVPARKR
jgi:hypothetical protein